LAEVEVVGKMWKFINRTTGSEMECNDLSFMMHQLRTVKGIDIPETEFVNVMLRGKASCTVNNEDGDTYEISIEEFLA
jgi:hypothetical protein